MVVAVKSFQDAFYYYLWVAITHFIFSLFSLRLSSISESFLTVKGAALFLPRGNGSSPSSASRFSQLRSKHAGEVPNNNLLFNCINHAFNKKFVIYAKVQFLTLIEVVFIALISPGDIQQHLQTMFTLLRPEDNIKLVGTHFKTEFCVCVKVSINCQDINCVFPATGGSIGERPPSDHPLHGGGLNQWPSGHRGERGAGNGFQSCR